MRGQKAENRVLEHHYLLENTGAKYTKFSGVLWQMHPVQLKSDSHINVPEHCTVCAGSLASPPGRGLAVVEKSLLCWVHILCVEIASFVALCDSYELW